MQFHYIKYVENFDDASELLASVVVITTLEVKPFVCSAALPKSVYKHVINSETL